MAGHARPGNDHRRKRQPQAATAGAFNTLAVGMTTEPRPAGLAFKRGENLVSGSQVDKITWCGRFGLPGLRQGPRPCDHRRIGVAGANYLSIEFHGEGVETLSSRNA